MLTQEEKQAIQNNPSGEFVKAWTEYNWKNKLSQSKDDSFSDKEKAILEEVLSSMQRTKYLSPDIDIPSEASAPNLEDDLLLKHARHGYSLHKNYNDAEKWGNSSSELMHFTTNEIAHLATQYGVDFLVQHASDGIKNEYKAAIEHLYGDGSVVSSEDMVFALKRIGLEHYVDSLHYQVGLNEPNPEDIKATVKDLQKFLIHNFEADPPADYGVLDKATLENLTLAAKFHNAFTHTDARDTDSMLSTIGDWFDIKADNNFSGNNGTENVNEKEFTDPNETIRVGERPDESSPESPDSVVARPITSTLGKGYANDPSQVKRLQQRLNESGANLKITAIFDEATYEAVVEFQDVNDLKHVDGIVGPETLARFKSSDRVFIGEQPTTTPPAPAPETNQPLQATPITDILALGRDNDPGQVKQLKQLLNESGATLDENGVFDQATHDAIIAFQRINELRLIDGVIGPETLGRLQDTNRQFIGEQPAEPVSAEKEEASKPQQEQNATRTVYPGNLIVEDVELHHIRRPAALSSETNPRAVLVTWQDGSGPSGEGVKAVQNALNAQLGINLTVSGVYDKATSDAVRNFQQLKGLEVDGKVGIKTINALIPE